MSELRGLRPSRLPARGLERFEVAALDQIDRTDLAGDQTAGLHVAPGRNVRQLQLARRLRQDHLFLFSHADRIRPDVMSITRKTLYSSLPFHVEYVIRLTSKGVMPASPVQLVSPSATVPLSLLGMF